MFNLKNKNAVIIGAGGHLCSEMALSLADHDVNLALLDIRKEKIKKENCLPYHTQDS